MTSLSLASLGASGPSSGGGGGSLAKQVFGDTDGGETPFSPLLFLTAGQAGRAGSPPSTGEGAGESPAAFLLQLLSPGLLQNLPAGAGGVADSASPPDSRGGMSALGGSSPLLTLLAGLTEKADLSASLKAFLDAGGQALSADALQQRFNALEEDKQQALLGEMAALLTASLPGAGLGPAPAGSLSLSGLSSVTEKGPQTDGTRAGLAAALQAEVRAALAAALMPSGALRAALAAHPQRGDVLSEVSDPTASSQRGAAQDGRPDPLTSGAMTGKDLLPASQDGETGALSLTQLQAAGLTARAAREADKAKGDGSTDPVTPAGAKASHTTDPATTTSAAATVWGPGSAGSAASHSDSKATIRLSGGSPSGSGDVEAVAGTDTSGRTVTSSLTGSLNPDGSAGLPGSANGTETARGTTFTEHLARLNRHGAFAPVTDQVAVHLSRGVHDGQDRMTIRLHPAELGRIEVRLDMTADGRVSASFSVDQPATLDLLQRDQKGLERALSDAGLKSESGSLNFSLRDGASHHGQQQTQQDNRSGADDGTPRFSLDLPPEEIPPAGQIDVTWLLTPNRLDVRI